MIDGQIIEAVGRPKFPFNRPEAIPSTPEVIKPELVTPQVQALLTVTQPVYEKYVEARKVVAGLDKTDKNSDNYSEITKKENLEQQIDWFNNLERRLRGLPYIPDSANSGLTAVIKLANENRNKLGSAPEDAKAAELNLDILKDIPHEQLG